MNDERISKLLDDIAREALASGDQAILDLVEEATDELETKQFAATDGGFVIQELGEDGYYSMVARVADAKGDRFAKLLNAGYAATEGSDDDS